MMDQFMQAALYGDINLINELIEDPRVDPSSRNNEAIISASLRGHLSVVERLLKDPRLDPSAQNNEAIIYAGARNHHPIANLLLSHPKVYSTITLTLTISFFPFCFTTISQLRTRATEILVALQDLNLPLI